MGGVKTAVFLVGLLNEHFSDIATAAERSAKRWKTSYDEFEAALPPPESRTVEQWEKLVELTGERYYSMATESNTGATARNVSNLSAALKELDGHN